MSGHRRRLLTWDQGWRWIVPTLVLTPMLDTPEEPSGDLR